MVDGRSVFAVELFILNFIGNFGNLHVLYLTIKRPELRGKSGLLQCILSTSHAICLISQLPNATLYLLGVKLIRHHCFRMIIPYIFFINFQCVMMLMMLLDIVFLLIAPLKYKQMSTRKFLATMLVLPVLCGLYFLVRGATTSDGEEVHFCTPPTGALTKSVSIEWLATMLATNTVIVIVYCITFALLHYIGKKKMLEKDMSRVARRLKVLLIVYIFSWYLSVLGANFLRFLFVGETLAFLQINMGIFVEVCYSQSFYTIMWRSKEYRRAFCDLYPRIFNYSSRSKSLMTVPLSKSSISRKKSQQAAGRIANSAAYFVILYAMKTPELMKNNSLRIMFIIGCYDAISLLENAFYPGYQCIVGGVFCTHPLSSLFMGNFALTMWFAASTTCAYLALGRYGDITGNRYIAVLFENKNRVTMGLVFILIYAIVGVGMTDTMMFNTVYMAYLFNPMNGKVTIQSLLTSSLYDLSAMAYTYINYFVVPDWVIVVCHLGYQLSSGVPCFIYICMNKTIRKNIIKMISGDAAKTSKVAYAIILYAMKTPELMKNSSLKIMFIIGVYDAISILENSFYPGYLCIAGGVYCTHPLTSLFFGKSALTMWFVASTTCAYLALGRYGDITGNEYISKLFETKTRVNICLVLIWVYAVVGVFVTDTMMFSTNLLAYIFNPGNGKADEYDFYNAIQIFQNMFVLAVITTLHLIICLRIRRDVQMWNQNSSFQRSVTIQSLLTSSIYDITALGYTFINYFEVPSWVIFTAHIGYQLSSGAPCFIYICMNKTIRRNIVKMISSDVQKVSHINSVSTNHQN
ncbi:unnamed protein product [Caenorhabditis auriculariae]|uniref:G-protein coupled receptors family 1 profile domain-containing protein n=1 Tax=Caenorhabditis auriculariae TaxID=2777116 RepID=A0A8S1HDA0_9PELO|nr:unnamed protein product [Caenorhabditis auriculariae]